MGPTRTAKFPSCMVLRVDVPSNATPIKLQNQLRDASGTMNFSMEGLSVFLNSGKIAQHISIC